MTGRAACSHASLVWRYDKDRGPLEAGGRGRGAEEDVAGFLGRIQEGKGRGTASLRDCEAQLRAEKAKGLVSRSGKSGSRREPCRTQEVAGSAALTQIGRASCR